MSQSEKRSTRCRSDFRFSLRGLLLVFVAVGLGLVVFEAHRDSHSTWIDEITYLTPAILAAIWFAFVIGLTAQARDLWRAFPQSSDVGLDVKWGWRYAVFWRLAASLLATFLLALDTAVEANLIELPERQDGYVDNSSFITQTIILLLTLLVVMSNRPIPQPVKRSSLLMWLIDAAGYVAALVYLMIFLYDTSVIPILVHIAILGVDQAQAARYSMFYPAAVPQHARFFWLTLGASLAVLANFWLTFQLAKRWTSSRGIRAMLLTPLSVGLAVTVVYVAWLYSGGLRIISPPFTEALSWGPVNRWIAAGALVTVAVTALTFRFVTSAKPTGHATGCEWIRPPGKYLHERASLLLLLGVAALIPDQLAYALTPGLSWTEWSETLRWFFMYHWFLMSLVVTLAALLAAWRSFRNQPSEAVFILPLPLAKTCVVWLALFVTAATGIPIAVWLGFAMWFAPF